MKISRICHDTMCTSMQQSFTITKIYILKNMDKNENPYRQIFDDHFLASIFIGKPKFSVCSQEEVYCAMPVRYVG